MPSKPFSMKSLMATYSCCTFWGPGSVVPVCQEMLSLSMIVRAGLGGTCRSLTDGRFSGGTDSLLVTLLRSSGWYRLTLGQVMVTVDQDTKEITMHVSDEELAKRKAETWRRHHFAPSSVSMLTSPSASRGAKTSGT